MLTNSVAWNRLLFQFAEWNNSKEFNAIQMKCLHSKTSQTDKYSDKYCTRDISIQATIWNIFYIWHIFLVALSFAFAFKHICMLFRAHIPLHSFCLIFLLSDNFDGRILSRCWTFVLLLWDERPYTPASMHETSAKENKTHEWEV